MSGTRQTPNSNLQSVTVTFPNGVTSGSQYGLQVLNTPGGTVGAIQYSNNGSFGGDSNLRWDSAHSNLLVRGNLQVSGNITGKVKTTLTNFYLAGGNSGDILTTTGTGELTWTPKTVLSYDDSNVVSILPSILANYTGNIHVNSIVGTSLTVSNAIFSNTATFSSNVVFTGVNKIKIPGGTNGQKLTTDGLGNVSWTDDLTNYTNSNVESYLSTFEGEITANSVTANFLVGNLDVSNVVGIGNIAILNLDGNASNVLYGNGEFAVPYGDSNVEEYLIAHTGNVSGNVITANFISGNGMSLSHISGSNVVGEVSFAAVANSVAVANVTGIGNIATVNKDGNINHVLLGNGTFGRLPILDANNNMSISGHVLPTSNISYDLGNNTNRFRDLYLSGTTINLGSAQISANGTQIVVSNTTFGGNTIVVDAGGGSNMTLQQDGNISTIKSSIGGVNIISGDQIRARTWTFDTSGTLYAPGDIQTAGNLVGGNSNLGNLAKANYFQGDGSHLSGITGANVTGQVNYAAMANSVSVANVIGIGSVSTVSLDGNASNILYGNGVFASAPSITRLTSNLNANTYSIANVGNITANANITAAYFIGNGSQLTGLPASYANSNVANYLPTYSGNISAINVVANTFNGNGSALSGLTGANVTGAVSYATTANSVAGSNVSGQVSYAATANSVAGANVSGAVAYATTANSVAGANVSGTVNNASHANVADSANSVAVANVSGIGNIALINKDGNASNILYGNGVFAAAPNSSSYGDSNVTTLLSSLGNNSISTNANISASNLAVTGSNTNLGTSILYANNSVYFLGTTSQISLGASLTTGAVTLGGGSQTGGITLGRSIANSNTYIQTGNLSAGSVRNIYVGTNGLANSTTNISIGSDLGNSTVTFGNATQVTMGNSLTVAGNISATNISGNINITGNVVGTSPNVTLVAGNYSYTFDNTGNFTMPTNSDIVFSANTTLTSLPGSNGNVTVNPDGTGQFVLTNITPATFGNALTVTGNVTVNGSASIVTPNRPAFRVYGSIGNTMSANTTVKSTNGATVDYNQGSYYDNSTGLFTAPVAGLYHCYATLRVGTNNGLNQATIRKNQNGNGANVVAFWETDTNTGTASHFSMTGYAKCAVGDTISLYILSGGVEMDANDSWGVTFIG